MKICIALFVSLQTICVVTPFLSVLPTTNSYFGVAKQTCTNHYQPLNVLYGSKESTVEVSVNADLDDEKVTSLFAWVSRAFAGDPQYNNLMLAIAAIFGNLPPESLPVQMAKEALKSLPPEEEPVGDSFSIQEREYNSLGAMGAAQWTGQFRTRPHALLELKNITTVDDWVKTLPRGCKRTIKRALEQNFTVTTKPILGGKPAPHSSLAHFRCVVAHEVRLLSNMYGEEAFFDALAEAVSRYIGTTRMTGDIREYRNATTNRVIAIAHEVQMIFCVRDTVVLLRTFSLLVLFFSLLLSAQVRKGKAIRGQWFYAGEYRINLPV
jgi:hypothetical protein